MSEDLPTIETTATTCQHCGTRTSASYHDGRRCNGLVIETDGSLQCSECGVGITGSSGCPSCGGSVAGTAPAIVSLRRQLPATEIAAALTRQLRRGAPTDLEPDATLSAIARAHVDTVVETTYFGANAGTTPLTARLDDHALAIGAGQTCTLELYPDGRTADDVASELYREFLTDFPEDGEATHLGVGVRWNPRGGVHVGVVAAKRLLSLPDDVAPNRLEQAIHRATNDRRASHGYDRLTSDTHLAGIAREHSRSMATRGFFAHETPAGETTVDRYDKADYDGRRAGENIAKQYAASGTTARGVAADIVDGWMDSPGHRENILTGSFTAEGIGVYQASDGAILATQNFS